MNQDLQKYLDGEIGLEELSPALRREAHAWEALISDAREAGAPGAPVGLESRILRSIAEGGRTGWWGRLVDWWLDPRPIRVRPLAWVAAVAIAGVLIVPVLTRDRAEEGRIAGGSADETVYVQFMLDAPEATSVAVAGDFNDWLPAIGLVDPDGDGIWSGRAPLMPGVHEYMFVIDGTQWLTDPQAERYKEDGFGHRNAVLAITSGAGAASLVP